MDNFVHILLPPYVPLLMEPLKARLGFWRLLERGPSLILPACVKSGTSFTMKMGQVWCKENTKLLKTPKAIIVLSSPWGFCGHNHIRGWKKKIMKHTVFLCVICKHFIAKMNHISLTSILVVFTSQAWFELVNVWPFIQEIFPKAEGACQELPWTCRIQRGIRQSFVVGRAQVSTAWCMQWKLAPVCWQQRRAIVSSLVSPRRLPGGGGSWADF